MLRLPDRLLPRTEPLSCVVCRRPQGVENTVLCCASATGRYRGARLAYTACLRSSLVPPGGGGSTLDGMGRDGTGRCTPPPNAAAHRRAPQQAAERRLTDDRQAGRARPGTRDPGPISPPSRFVLPPPSRPLVGCGPCQGASCEACAARATRRARRLCEVPCRCLRTRSVSVGRPPHQGQGASYPKFRRLGLAHTCRRLVVVRICLSHRHCGRSGPLGLGPVVGRRLLPAPALV